MGKALSAVLVFFVRAYQALLSPWLGSNCRHQPTCSAYMIESIGEWGPFRGTWMGLRRILKCHPWGTSGHDPVPMRAKKGEASGAQRDAG